MRTTQFIAVLAFLLAVGCRRAPSSRAANLADAAAAGDVAAVSQLLAAGANPNQLDAQRRTPIIEAVKRPNNRAVIDLLTSHGVSVKTPANAWALIASHSSNIPRLIELGADVNAGRGTAWSVLNSRLMYDGDDPSAIRVLLQQGADTTQPAESLVEIAAKQRHLSVAKALVDGGAWLGKDKGGASLALAIQFGDDGLIRALLAHGGDANWCDRFGASLVMYAARLKYVDCIDDLVRAGADPNRADDSGKTPYWVARNDDDVRVALARNGGYEISPQQVLAERKRTADGGK